MGVIVERAANAGLACERALVEVAGEGRATAWLLPDYDRVVERRKVLAAARSALSFGCTVETLDAWVDDLWALYGDGRGIVASVQRKIIMRNVLKESGLFPVSAGRIDALCSMAQQGAGLEVFMAAVRGGFAGLSATQAAMLEAARAYYGHLADFGLVERAEAMGLLAGNADVRWPVIACEGFEALSASEAAFFAALSRVTDVRFAIGSVGGSCFDVAQGVVEGLRCMGACVENAGLATDSGHAPGFDLSSLGDRGASAELRNLAARLYAADDCEAVRPEGALRALLPAGRYARFSLIASTIAEEAGSVLVVCNDPRSMLQELAPRLAACGIAVEGSYSRPFGDTDFGEAFFNAHDAFGEGAFDSFQATDYLLSVLSEKGPRAAASLDASWRGNRLADRMRIAADVDAYAQAFAAPFARLVTDGRFAEAFDLAEARYCACASDDSRLLAEQLAAIKCARTMFDQVSCVSNEEEPLFDVARLLLERANVCVHVRSTVTAPDGSAFEPQVCIVSYREASALESASFDVVIACDLNASDQPLRARRTSVDGLLDALGCAYKKDALFEARLRMLRIVELAAGRLYLERVLHDADASPTYPAVVFEEVIDCYRVRTDGKAEPLDKATALTSELAVRFCAKRGEEELVGNMDQGARGVAKALELGLIDAIAPASKQRLLEPVSVLSPSSIENYLDCPHKWFATRRLCLNRVDAEFGPCEKGTFIHEVLEGYYKQHLQRFGVEKPRSKADLPHALALLDEIFDAARVKQPEKDLFDNPLIPITQAEDRQMDELRRHLRSFVERDAALLPGFAPKHFELRFGYDETFVYAGVPVKGSIDRIDVDEERGLAVVVDYKSSLGDAYHLLPVKADGAFCLPSKIQTLIYAQVVRRLLGLKPVAALYVHTLRPGSQPKACGAYDDAVFGPQDLLGINAKRNGLSYTPFGSFEDLLDEVESLIGRELKRLADGDIAIAPRSDKSCGFCPVLSCAGRK